MKIRAVFELADDGPKQDRDDVLEAFANELENAVIDLDLSVEDEDGNETTYQVDLADVRWSK